MDRRTFIRRCGHSALAIPVASVFLGSCNTIYYAAVQRNDNILTVPKSEFIQKSKGSQQLRRFVLISIQDTGFPICLYRKRERIYTAVLLRCTHRSCELGVGGGMYSCPCHGSEFSIDGKVLQGPAARDLMQFKTTTDDENIYIYII